MTQTQTFRVWRGNPNGGAEKTYEVPLTPGMVVLDAIHWIQGHKDGDLACRWNCKAAKCGSCSAEVNGRPRLMCKTRVEEFAGAPIRVHPIKAFPILKDLVTDVSWNYEVKKRIPGFTPDPDEAQKPLRMAQADVDRVQEFRKCIECFLCQDVCHVLRDHKRFDRFSGPRFLIRIAELEMHPKDTLNRADFARKEAGIGFCNITKCCTEVCPEHIKITDNGIIPLKERVVNESYDPVLWFLRKVTGQGRKPAKAETPPA
jgi:succinate dehydrogenase / fumarate reductase, iron-sulfur subunit